MDEEVGAAAAFRHGAGRVVAALFRAYGDFDLAEDVVQDALLAAVERWATDGVPDNPAAWLMTTARRRAIDRIRRDARYRDKLAALAARPAVSGTAMDERLLLIFMCCHPALAAEARLPLTLRAVLGMTTGQIARAFLASETTVAQRLTRAKRKIVEAGISLRAPEPADLGERLDSVLAVIYLMFNEGYLTTGPGAPDEPELVAEADYLASLVAGLLPDHAEPAGLLALIRLHRARSAARFAPDGSLVLLSDQDRGRWDSAAIVSARMILEGAMRTGGVGPYCVQAAIAACHAEAPSWVDTDWRQILALYGVLARMTPTPVVMLNRAIALSHVDGTEPALREIDRLEPQLRQYHLFHATRAQLLRDLGRIDDAREADRCALALTRNRAERGLLAQRLGTADAQ